MPRTGRPPRNLRYAKQKISIPIDIHNAVDEILHDPMYDKPARGAWSDLCTRLLRDWLAKQSDIHTLSTGAANEHTNSGGNGPVDQRPAS